MTMSPQLLVEQQRHAVEAAQSNALPAQEKIWCIANFVAIELGGHTKWPASVKLLEQTGQSAKRFLVAT